MSGGESNAPRLPVDADTALEVLRSIGTAMERDPNPYFGMDEPNLRACLLSALSGAFAGRATAETFNVGGKTDILVRSDDRNVLIVECKVYNGVAGLLAAVEQILGYTSWRDTRLALVIFVRSNDVSRAVDAARAAAERSERVTAIEPDPEHEGELRLAVTRPGDSNRSIELRTLIVYVPIPAGRRPRKPSEVVRPEDALEALLEIKRVLPNDEGVDYTPVLRTGTVPPLRHDPEPWRVTLTRETQNGDAVGIEAVPTTERAVREQAPQGSIVAPDDETAATLHSSLRRTQRDLVPTTFTGVGIRLDQVAAAFRDSADRLEGADPNNLTLVYGPRDLWQCRLRLETDRGHIDTPIAFVREDPAPGWDATVRGTIFDFALAMSMRREGRETQFEWTLTGETEKQPAAERLAAIEFLYVYSGVGTMTITSIEPEIGNGSFELDGFDLEADTLFERDLFANLTAIERHSGVSISVPDRLNQSWVNEVFTAGGVLRTGRAGMTVDQFVARISQAEGIPDVGSVGRWTLPIAVAFEVAGHRVELGTGLADVVARVAEIRPDGEKAAVTFVPANEDARHVSVSGFDWWTPETVTR